MPTLQEVSARMPELKASPRVNPKTGAVADFLKYLKSPKSSQQMQALMGVLPFVDDLETTLDRVSYGEPLTTGQGMTTALRPEAKGMVELATLFAPASRPAMSAIKATKGMPLGMSIKDVGAPQEAALRLAQQRAALPVEKGGLGLPMDNTAMDRAKAMGFDTPAFHGSKDPSITAFDPSLAGKSTSNAFDNNIWATSSPEVARGYSLDANQFRFLPQVKEISAKVQSLTEKYNAAYKAGKFDEMDKIREKINLQQTEKQNLYKSFLKGDITSEGSTIYPLLMRGSELMPYEAGGANWMKANRQAIDEAAARGYGGVSIKNVNDNTLATNKIISDTFATENPDLIRSRFAAFDPFRKSAATAATMGVAAPNLLAQERDPMEILLQPRQK
jgi:hypothetical protein